MKIDSISRKEFFNSIREADNTKLSFFISQNIDFIHLSRNVYQYTTIELAIKHHNYEAFNILLQNGFNASKVVPNKKYNSTWASIIFTIIRQSVFGAYPIRTDIIEFDKLLKILDTLLKLGKAEINIADEHGINPIERALYTVSEVLHQPYSHSKEESDIFIENINQVFKTLMENGANLNFITKRGMPFLELVKEYNFEKYLPL